MSREEQWSPLIRTYADELGLKDWRFIVSDEDAPDDAYAMIDTTYGRKVAVIKVCKEFESEPDWKQRECLIHELIHCHFDGMDRIVDTISDQLHRDVWSVFYASFRREVEIGTDAIALAIAAHFPLPVSLPIEEGTS